MNRCVRQQGSCSSYFICLYCFKKNQCQLCNYLLFRYLWFLKLCTCTLLIHLVLIQLCACRTGGFCQGRRRWQLFRLMYYLVSL